MAEDTTDKKGRELIRQFEESRDNRVSSPPDDSYDWLVVESSGDIHAEVKTAESAGRDWFAINGFKAVRRMIEDQRYRLYFCILGPPSTILRCKTVLLFPLLGWSATPEMKEDLVSLEKALEKLKSVTKMPFDCRVRFHIRGGIGGTRRRSAQSTVSTRRP